MTSTIGLGLVAMAACWFAAGLSAGVTVAKWFLREPWGDM